MFFGLTDLILDRFNLNEEVGQEYETPLCAPRDRTVCVDSRIKIWNIFEEPETSTLAKIVNLFSIFFILLSTVSH